MEKRENELVWMQRKRGAEQRTSKRLEKHSKGRGSGMAQKGKSTAEQYTTRRVGTHSKRGGSQREVRRTFKILREV